MKLKKRIIAWILVLSTLLSIVPVYAEEDITGAYAGGKKKMHHRKCSSFAFADAFFS